MVRDTFKQYCQEKLMSRIVLANRNEGKQPHCQAGGAEVPPGSVRQHELKLKGVGHLSVI